MTDPEAIEAQISLVRGLLHQCATTLQPFDGQIVSVLQLSSIVDYSSIIDCFYVFEDTELAKDHVRKAGLGSSTDQADFGLVYLKFYGLMNACYMQQQAIIVCISRLSLPFDLTPINTHQIVQYRNDFAAHSPNRGHGKAEHSFVLDRFGLLEGRISGYTANSPQGLAFRNAATADLLADWDRTLRPALEAICGHMVSLIQKRLV